MTEVSEEQAQAFIPLFDPIRLQIARETRGLTQRELASRKGSPVSPAAISLYEKGDARPSARTFAFLATELRFPPEFFVGGRHRERRPLEGYFRSLTSVSAKDRRKARARAYLIRYLSSVLSANLDFPPYDLPRLPVGEGEPREAVEEIAEEVRRAWKLALKPISSMVDEVERHGIVAARLTVDIQGVDAFSVPFLDTPVIVLAADKNDRARSRFDAAHEIGHLIMHEPTQAGRRSIERQAQWFAAALLMPAEAIAEDLPNRPDWRHLLTLKQQWGVSMTSLLMRARNLGLMSKEAYVRGMKQVSARGWRRNEPGYLGPPEQPSLLREALRPMMGSSPIVSRLSEDTSLPQDELARLLEGIDAGGDSPSKSYTEPGP